MTPRPPLSPWLVAALFAPTALLLWAVATGVIPIDQKNLRTVFQAIALTQLFLAVAIYEAVPGLAADDRAERPAWQRLMLAFGVLIVTQVAHLAVAEKAFATIAIATALAALAQQVVVIALAEELWFRGLWMRAAAGRPLLAVFGGAAAFGLYHLHQGWEWVEQRARSALRCRQMVRRADLGACALPRIDELAEYGCGAGQQMAPRSGAVTRNVYRPGPVRDGDHVAAVPPAGACGSSGKRRSPKIKAQARRVFGPA